MNLFNSIQRLKDKISVISSKKAQRGKSAKAQKFVPVLYASGLLCLCACLLVSSAWAKSSSRRRNPPRSSSSPVLSENTKRNPTRSPLPVSSDTERQFLIEDEREYKQPQRPVTNESVDLLKEKLNEKQGVGFSNQGPGKTSSSGILTPTPLFPSSSPNSGASMLKAALSLVLVLALIWGMSYLVKKYYLKGNLLGEKYIRTLDTCSLGSKGSLALVRVEDQTLLLGITSQEITLLAQVNIPDKSMPEKSKMRAADPQKRNGISNKQSGYPNPANRSARSAKHAQDQVSTPTGALNLSPKSWTGTGLDGEENQGQDRDPYHSSNHSSNHSSKVFDDFAEQLSLQSMRFQPPEQPEGRNRFHDSNVQESSTDTIAGILESRFRGLKRI